MSIGRVDPRFGRLIPDRDTVDLIKSSIPPAPKILPKKYKGKPPRRSPGIRKFRNPRFRNQWIGMCVGKGLTAMGETTIRTPETFDETTPALEGVHLSSLWTYFISRRMCEEQGIHGIMDGEGSLVSMGMLALQKYGYRLDESWPTTEENQKTYYKVEKKGGYPGCEESEPINVIDHIGAIMSWNDGLSYMGMGYSLSAGISWPSNAGKTDAKHRFSWSGASIGGHCVELIDYDLDADLLWVGNSWMGEETDEAISGWGDDLGVGVTKLSSFAREMTDAKLKTFKSELNVTAGVDGFVPKFLDPYDYL